MKDKIKGFVFGLILGIAIISTVVMATTGTINKELWYNNIKITLDNKEIIPKDVNGNYVEPFIIDGTTYLPVRAVSKALGLIVDWDDKTRTVMLSSDDLGQQQNMHNGKHFTIATDTEYAPFEFKNENNDVVGIDVEILDAIAKDRGFTYDLQYIGWDAAISACFSGQADGMIAGISVTDYRKENGWIFSDAYYTDSWCMAVAKGSDINGYPDINKKKIAVKSGTIGDVYIQSLKDKYDVEIVFFDTTPDMCLAVSDGKVDALIDNTTILKYAIKHSDLNMKIVKGTEFELTPYAFAVFDKSDQQLIDLFNEGLNNIRKNGKYDEIIAKYLG